MDARDWSPRRSNASRAHFISEETPEFLLRRRIQVRVPPPAARF
jgi:hypothetical protein